MLRTLSSKLEELRIIVPQGFSLEDVSGFPYSEYQANQARYTELLQWFTGDALNVTISTKNGKKVDPYPIKINPLRAMLLKHAYALFGETNEDARPLVIPRAVADSDSQKATVEHIDTQLNHLWWDSNGRSLMSENGFIAQVFGGCVFRLAYRPWETWRTVPIAVERIYPFEFVPVPDMNDPWRLREGWIVRQITQADAAGYGVAIDEESGWWIEHWTREYYETKINDKVVVQNIAGEPRVFSGVNPYGYVPMVYIPTVRMSTFYGMTLIDHLKGLIKEYNSRMADWGDAVNQDSHANLFGSNIAGTPKIVTLENGTRIIMANSASSFTGNDKEPKLSAVITNSASTPMEKLADEIYKQIRRDGFLPGVADGEDEGSQRSGETLLMRMWPMLVWTNSQRINWTDGLNWLNKMGLGIMKTHSIAGIGEEHLKMRLLEEWASALPKDRQAFVNELVTRASANIGSVETLMTLAGDIEDVPADLEKVKEWLAYLEEIKVKFQAKYQINQGPFGAGGSPTQPKSAPKKE